MRGDQNYDLPATVDLNQYQAVAIYCERFTRYLEWRSWRSFSGGRNPQGLKPVIANRVMSELKLRPPQGPTRTISGIEVRSGGCHEPPLRAAKDAALRSG